jgi:(p)ppGpp synthase/HD superfamily hydrolase
MLNKAIEIASKAHTGQTDKSGNPYILHPLRVMMNFCADNDEVAQSCAALHDVIEYTEE